MDKRLPSGVFGTAWINCLCEAILEVLQFYFCMHYEEHKEFPKFGTFVEQQAKKYSFFEQVSLINYGDDNLKYVSPICRKYYTHEAITLFSDFIVMGITPAHKMETEIQFKKVTSTLFLKRTPTFNQQIQMLVGKLELKSIGRMLAFTDSRDPHWREMVISQAARELSFYDDGVFDTFQSIFGTKYDQLVLLSSMMFDDVWNTKVDDNIPYYEVISEYSVSAPSKPNQGLQNRLI